MSHVSFIMSLETLIDPQLAAGIDARVGFRFGDADYVTTILDGRLEAKRGEVAGCDLIFTGGPIQLAAVVHGGAPLETVGAGGDMTLARRFLTLFPLPPKVSED